MGEPVRGALSAQPLRYKRQSFRGVLGTADVNRIEVRGLRIADVRTPFRSSARPAEPQPSLAFPDGPIG